MKIITTTSRVIRAYGEEKGIEMLAKAGFDGVDVSMFFKPGDDSILTKSDDEVRAYYTNLREIIEKNGLYVYQTHTPFPVISDNLEENAERWEMQRKALMASGIVGARQAIVHPTKFYPQADGTLGTRIYNRHKEENLAYNREMYGRLLPYLEEYHIKAAIENMFGVDPAKKNVYCPNVCSNPDELAQLCDDCNAMCKNGDMFVVCMDIGHTNLSAKDKTVRQYVNTLGKRLTALHLHDNYGIKDDHTAPGFGNVDWGSFFDGLRDVGYDGDFVYEADNFLSRFHTDMMADAEIMLCKIARRLCEKHGM